MKNKVAIVGFGYTVPKSKTPELSYKELTFLAAQMAYKEARIKPGEVDSFVAVSEDLHEGTSIFDEYVPDQIGAVQKPVHTISGDGIQGIISACLQIMTGMFDIIVVEGHSKASNILTPNYVMNYALDPVINRPLGVNPYYIAGLEMRAYQDSSGVTSDDIAKVVSYNKSRAVDNKLAPHGTKLTPARVLSAEPLFEPLGKQHLPAHSDAAYVIVLASNRIVKKKKSKPVWISGMGYCSDSPTLESRDWTAGTSTRMAAEKAYKLAEITNPAEQIDVFEVDDSFGYKQLQNLEALGVLQKGGVGTLFQNGKGKNNLLSRINPSGGTLGVGWMHEATGLHKTLEVYLQLKGAKGKNQIKGAKTGLAQCWRGIPTTTSAVIILQK
ncbi:MAG: acetyl-CoA acetyltransferase [candidate division Zixibacteria bacterium]|nr:acetyl-CoA acetyltransferase [candidate division Zixibacteria bacterium]